MTPRVLKYKIEPPVTRLPYCRPLSVGVQNGEIFVWAERDETVVSGEIKVFPIRTGDPTPIGVFLGTAILGEMVFHFYYSARK